MLNQQTNTKNRSQSKFLGQRRKRQLLIDVRRFVRKHNAMVWHIDMGGNLHRCIIQTEDGKNAFAWGSSKSNAFYNMLPKFNLKYAV